MNSKYCFGIDIGGTTVKCGLFTIEGELIEKWEIVTNRENQGSAVPKDVSDTIHAKMIEKKISADDVTGVGVGIPGPVTKEGVVLKCANLGWDVMDVNKVMSELTGLKVLAANDANVAALGEMWKGGGKGYRDVIMVTLGTGVGGGVIIDGTIRAGSNGAGGEIGHITVNPSEEAVCGCGNKGHLEQYASATGVVRIGKKLLAETTMPSILRGKPAFTAKDIFDAAKEKDKLALAIVDQFGEYLGLALSHVAATVDPEVFVIGGGMAAAGEIIIDSIRHHYNKNILNALRDKEFRLAELGNDAGIYGCAKLVLSL